MIAVRLCVRGSATNETASAIPMTASTVGCIAVKMPELVKELQANWITSGQLERLQSGMTVDEVTTIVGSKGFVLGADGAGSETHQWFGPGIRYSELVFQAGVLVSITQSDTPGLPTSGR